MKFTLLLSVLLFATVTANAQILDVTFPKEEFPTLVGWVNDYEDVFTDKEKEQLTYIIDSFRKKKGVQICVVTLTKETVEKAFV